MPHICVGVYISASKMSSKFEVVVLFSSFVVALGSRLEDFKSIYPSVKNGNDTRIPLTLGLMVSFSGDYVTSSSIASVQIALDLINENSSLLPGYRLQYKLTDSQVGIACPLDTDKAVVQTRGDLKFLQILAERINNISHADSVFA